MIQGTLKGGPVRHLGLAKISCRMLLAVVCSALAASAGADPLTDKMLSLQTWNTLQATLVWQLAGVSSTPMSSTFYRDARTSAVADFANPPISAYEIFDGETTSNRFGKAIAENALDKRGIKGNLTIMRLLGAEKREGKCLKVDLDSGNTIVARWTDFPSARPLTITVDDSGRIMSVSTEGHADVENVIYGSQNGKLFVSEWDWVFKPQVSVFESKHPRMRYHYRLENVQLDGSLPAGAFKVPTP
jgi:hypothetical protein